jgi:hypothetical protein
MVGGIEMIFLPLNYTYQYMIWRMLKLFLMDDVISITDGHVLVNCK